SPAQHGAGSGQVEMLFAPRRQGVRLRLLDHEFGQGRGIEVDHQRSSSRSRANSSVALKPRSSGGGSRPLSAPVGGCGTSSSPRRIMASSPLAARGGTSWATGSPRSVTVNDSPAATRRKY